MPSDLPPLLLPATPALLDGWVGPVVVTSGGLRTCAIDGRVPDHPDNADCTPWRPPLSLDLSRAECRDRVARVAFGRPGVLRLHRGHVLSLGPYVVARTKIDHSPHRPGASSAYQCTALAALDPDDDRRLPDGSRWVDAAAMLAVAQEVLHGE